MANPWQIVATAPSCVMKTLLMDEDPFSPLDLIQNPEEISSGNHCGMKCLEVQLELNSA